MAGLIVNGPLHRDAGAHRIAILVFAALLVGIVRSLAVLHGEAIVASAEQRQLDSAQMAEADGVTDIAGAGIDLDAPPRALMADALYLAGGPSRSTSPDARRALARASAEIAAATARRPYWGDAWAARAYISAARFGETSAITRNAYERSYADGPYLRFAAPWRVRYAFDHWRGLDAGLRGRALDEAVWLVRVDPAVRDNVFALARQSPAYALLMRRWRAIRAGDPDFAQRDCATPQEPCQK